MRREDVVGTTHFRSDRLFCTGDAWFFQTREGIDVGPYESQLEAEIEAGMLKELIKNSHVDSEALGVLREFILESFSLGRPLNVMISDDAEHIELERPLE